MDRSNGELYQQRMDKEYQKWHPIGRPDDPDAPPDVEERLVPVKRELTVRERFVTGQIAKSGPCVCGSAKRFGRCCFKRLARSEEVRGREAGGIRT